MGFSRIENGLKKTCIYQDLWLDGRAVEKGGRECAFRFEAIYKLLKKLKRPIKVLDIGCNMGYFSLRLAEHFDGLFVMVEGSSSTADSLLKLLKLNRNNKSIFLKKTLNLEDLRYFAEHESFDVVLALSIIHHFNEPYEEVFQVLRKLGSYLIFEPPVPNERTLNQDRIKKEPISFKSYPHYPLVEIPAGSKESTHATRITYLLPCQEFKEHPMALRYDTFKRFNGQFPERDYFDMKDLAEERPEQFLLTGSSFITKEN